MPPTLHSAPRSGPSTSLLINAVQCVSAARSLEDIMDIVKRTARQGVAADGVTFVLRDGDECHYADEDAMEPLWKGRRFPLKECISGWTMLHRSPTRIADIRLDARIPQEAYRPTFVRSLVMVPIRSMAPLGAIGAYWSQVHEASDETVHWLQALADATSAGLESVHAMAVVQRSRDSQSPFPDGGPVRMCAWTKRLFHEGHWLPIEAFLRRRFHLEVTHGMSEEALAQLTDELARTRGPDPRTFPAGPA